MEREAALVVCCLKIVMAMKEEEKRENLNMILFYPIREREEREKCSEKAL